MRITPELLRTIDWAKNPLGPIEQWPRSLKSYVDMIFALPTPAIIFWGPEQTQIYNDGYAVIMGPRHPKYFGAPYRLCWPDTYEVIIPWMRQVLDEGKPVEVARAPFTLTRHGFTEEAYFTFTFSPLRDDDGRIAGIYQPVVEATDAVLAERRNETLHALAAARDVLARAVSAFEANAKDIPCAAVWTAGEHGLQLGARTGFASEGALAFAEETVARVFETNAPLEVDASIAVGPWPEPVSSLFVVPLRRASGDAPMGVAAFGKSARLRFDAAYRSFFEAVAREIATNLAAQRAEQAEKDAIEREQAMRRETERRLSVLFEYAPVGIAVLRGPELVFEVANPSYRALAGERTLLGKPLREAMPELAEEGILELVSRVYSTGVPYIGRSTRLLHERFFDFVYQPLPGEDGATESIIVVCFDVTELARARRDAEEANRAKDEFFAILGHELRNPLAPISTALQLMRLRGDASLAKERTIIERQVGHITRLLDDLLDASRITRGKVELKREPLEISQVIAKAIEMSSPLLEQRRHHLDVDVPVRGLTVEGDSARLAQVVSNLLINAAKYTEPGGHVTIRARRASSGVLLEVSDDGIGIAPSMLERIFAPFAQERQALDRAQGGLGLGLTIVANLVKLHGGTVSAHSAGRGKGSTFTIELPLAHSSTSDARDTAGASSSTRPPAALRVLVVDDNEDAAEMLSEALGALGYSTRVAHDAPEALRVAATFAPDVALLDIGLPVMDGYELAARLRSSPGGDRMRLVAVTGYGQESDRRRTREAGFDAHVVKPVEITQLMELVADFQGAPRAGVTH
jgi:signal transduction histidine kinase/CheY-like chemotaxis protein